MLREYNEYIQKQKTDTMTMSQQPELLQFNILKYFF